MPAFADLMAAVVRILDSAGKPVGVGFAVGEGEFITCAHVVEAALRLSNGGRPDRSAIVRFDAPFAAPGQAIAATVARWPAAGEQDDIAGLRVTSAVPTGLRTMHLLGVVEPWGHRFRMFGFPQGHDQGFWLSGRLREHEAVSGLVQMDQRTRSGVGVLRGFSGAPVWDENVSAVVGMVASGEIRSDRPSAYMIPASSIINAWPEGVAQLEQRCPYRELMAFRPEDAPVFFGRTTLRDDLLSDIAHKPFVVVVGPSGIGKSSLLAAGVVAELLRDRGQWSDWRIAELRPLPEPMVALTDALLALSVEEWDEAQRRREARLRAESLTGAEVADWVERLLRSQKARRLLLVVDQFEELFTLPPEVGQRFIDVVVDAVAVQQQRTVPTLTVAIGLRDDFQAQALEHAGLEAIWHGATRWVGPMRAAQLREVIERPLASRARLDPDLTDRIIEDLGEATRRPSGRSERAGKLPLLEFALTELWYAQVNGRLTHAAYEKIGRVGGALARYADGVLAGLPEATRKAAESVLAGLVRPGADGQEPTRRLLTRSELSLEHWQVAQALATKRLVVIARSDNDETVELAHDSLVQLWKPLRQWIEQDREFRLWKERLRERVRVWQAKGAQSGELLSGGALAEARTYERQRRSDLSKIELAFIAASAANRRRRRSIASSLVAVAAVLIAVAVAAAGLRAREAATQRQMRVTRDIAARVANEARELAGGDTSGLGLLLAMASDDIAAQVGDPATTFPRMAQDYATLVRVLGPQDGRYVDAAISHDGFFALLKTRGGTIQLISMRTGQVRWQLDSPPRRPLSLSNVFGNDSPPSLGRGLAFAPSGRLAAVVMDSTITLLDTETGSWAPHSKLSMPMSATAVRFGSDGKSLVVYNATAGRLFRYNLAQRVRPPSRCRAPKDAADLTVTDDNAFLVREAEITEVRFADCSASVAMKPPHDARWQAAQVDQNGRLMGIAMREAQLVAVRARQPEMLLSERGPYTQVHATLSSDGVHVSASTKVQTVGWLVDERVQELMLHAPGMVLSSAEGVVWIHDSIVEVHDRGQPAAALKTFLLPYSMTVAWSGADLVVRRPGDVVVISDAENWMDETKMRKLPMPGDAPTAAVDDLATSIDGPWAAGIVREKGGQRRTLVVWDVPSGRILPVSTPDDDSPTQVAFSDRRLLVGYRSGVIRRFELRQGRWEPVGAVRLPGPILALASRDSNGSIYAVALNHRRPKTLSDLMAADAIAARISKSDFLVADTRSLTAPSAKAALVVLEDGQVVIGYGDGKAMFLDPELSVRGTFDSGGRLGSVVDASEVPGLRQVIVSGRYRSVVLDALTRVPLAAAWRNYGSFTSTSATADGRVLATSSFVRSQIVLWPLSRPDLRRRVCKAVGRDLTQEEWARFIGPDPAYRPVCGT